MRSSLFSVYNSPLRQKEVKIHRIKFIRGPCGSLNSTQKENKSTETSQGGSSRGPTCQGLMFRNGRYTKRGMCVVLCVQRGDSRKREGEIETTPRDKIE